MLARPIDGWKKAWSALSSLSMLGNHTRYSHRCLPARFDFGRIGMRFSSYLCADVNPKEQGKHDTPSRKPMDAQDENSAILAHPPHRLPYSAGTNAIDPLNPL